MKLISWNIQWSRGVDGKVDPQRIVADARKLGDFDVLCLQEVAANFPSLAGSAGENQFEIFADLLPGFTPVPAAAVDVAAADGSRRCFGNMVLSRYPVLRVLRHQLPWPADADVISMPRVLLEVTLDTPLGPVRVMNTHLEYYSQLQRKQQVEAIRNYHAETSLRALRSRVCETGPSPYHAFAQTSKVILTGDFNFRPEDPLHERLQEKLEPGVPRLVDTWEYLNGNQPHPHNVGVYDREQWEEAFACDFIFASEDLLPHVRTFKIDGKTKASDHQPQLLELA
ncbi:endonuclease/exonuclease/phosphatase family protein [Herbaspirillum autotrophicum]|uniref:endonuclease/exonuclease/phosphatase family protein n=1 Tax=Herbaspirillum autotrophicum TaxID=180195 RepID=UPI00067E36F3|nr:endonuclease/exonuclease/phosphatase family protein [Herbaspirillum autotrophicum]